MIKPTAYISILLVALSAVLFVSCTQSRQPCLTPQKAALNVRAVRLSSANTVIDTPIATPLFVSVTAEGNKYFLYTVGSAFTLSLSPVADTALWLFATDTTSGSPFDSVIFRYTRELTFISNACGYTYYYNLTDVSTSHNIIDSVSITNSSVTSNVSTSHLQIFVRP